MIISFIIPLYNVEDYITECINSILQCRLKNTEYEIIVWNDGSSDNGPEIVSRMARGNHCIKLINQDNHGVSYARNNALKIACGEYIWFVDADDMIVPATVQILMEKAKRKEADIISFCWKALVGNRLTPGIHDVSNCTNVISGRDLFISQQLMMAPWTYIYRRKFLKENNLSFPEDYKTCEDIQFNQKALFAAKRVITSCETAYIYRVRENSATQGKGKALSVLKDQTRRFFEEIQYFLPSFDLPYLSVLLYRNLKEIIVWGRLFIKETMK